MKEIADPALLADYMDMYKLRSVFPEALLPYLTLYGYDQGELICTQGEPSHSLYVLVRGKIKIFNTSPEGRTLVISFKNPLEVVGDVEFIRNGDIINTVEAVSPVHMIGVEYRWLHKYSADHSPLLHFLLDIITKKFYMKSSSMSFNLLYPVEIRLASYLLSVSYDEADALFLGKLGTSDLADAANLIGTSYRHLNRVLQKFAELGLIERSRQGITVTDREGLRNLVSRNIYE
ncbi:cAMP receptor protein [compost metagenome]|uniref:Crp/Fnr family transcriptional regulator n=1 Tax=Paenibacillus rhizolycopersici TaxID=2780073 RepID=A0ABS2H8J4_9BACL|nr:MULTISPECIES: Crp/Fnr family transcriptional regulator [Paenibacillus]MBM6997747.1 Crp/Fnr family transcriptional regulator [Paenibacillus rhizolycopersici]MUG86333.1 cyclic nucleotide-binding domain-containing protein [Paenibacillus timonensis]